MGVSRKSQEGLKIDGDDDGYDESVAGVCGMLYEDSAKCNRYMGGDYNVSVSLPLRFGEGPSNSSRETT